MNIISKITVTILCSIVFCLTAYSQEYKMIKSGQTITTDPNSLIEVVGSGATGGTGSLNFKLDGDTTTYTLSLELGVTVGSTNVSRPNRSNIITGAVSLTAFQQWVVVKISPSPTTTPTQPSNVAVIPNDANGQYQVILESSVDMVTWNPANPGNFSGSTASRFFRTRIVKQP